MGWSHAVNVGCTLLPATQLGSKNRQQFVLRWRVCNHSFAQFCLCREPLDGTLGARWSTSLTPQYCRQYGTIFWPSHGVHSTFSAEHWRGISNVCITSKVAVRGPHQTFSLAICVLTQPDRCQWQAVSRRLVFNDFSFLGEVSHSGLMRRRT